MTLLPCLQCRRHVEAGDACPFCGARSLDAQVATAPLVGRWSRAAVFAGATLAPACWTNPPSRTTPMTSAPQDRAVAERGVVTGIATNSYDGRPVVGLYVQLIRPGAANAEARTDERGRYVFKDLAPGDYSVQWYADVPTRRPQARPVTPSTLPVTVKAGQTVQADLIATQPPPMPVPTPYGAPPARRRVV